LSKRKPAGHLKQQSTKKQVEGSVQPTERPQREGSRLLSLPERGRGGQDLAQTQNQKKKAIETARGDQASPDHGTAVEPPSPRKPKHNATVLENRKGDYQAGETPKKGKRKDPPGERSPRRTNWGDFQRRKPNGTNIRSCGIIRRKT